MAHSAKPPLFFQHQGHSRTVVGVERRRLRWDSEEETFLIILDPSTRTTDLVGKLREGKGWQSAVKRGLATLRGREYQVVAVLPGIAKESEREARARAEPAPSFRRRRTLCLPACVSLRCRRRCCSCRVLRLGSQALKEPAFMHVTVQ